MLLKSYANALKGLFTVSTVAAVVTNKILHKTEEGSMNLHQQAYQGMHARDVLIKAGAYAGYDQFEEENKKYEALTKFFKDALYSRLRNDENGFYIDEEDIEFIRHIAETQYDMLITKHYDGQYFPGTNVGLFSITKLNQDNTVRWDKVLIFVFFSQRDGSLKPKFYIK